MCISAYWLRRNAQLGDKAEEPAFIFMQDAQQTVTTFTFRSG
jgi:hypothetical protein